jgi:hypothetical protein
LRGTLAGIVLTLLSVSMLALGSTSANGYVGIQLRQDQSTLTLHQYTFYNWQITAQEFTKYTDALQMHYDQDNPSDSNSIENIHLLRPDYVGLLYRDITKVSSDSPEYSTFVSNGWLLRDIQGNIIYSSIYGNTSQMVDLGNPDYQNWLADWISNQTTLHGYNGVFCDDGLGAYVGEIWWDANTLNIINPRTSAIWTDQEVRDALIGLYTQLRNKMPAILVVTNGIYSGDKWQTRKDGYEYIINRTDINGVMGEGWWREWDGTVWYSEASWKNSLDSLIELESYFIQNKTTKLFIPCCYTDVDGVDSQLPPGTTQLQVARYGFVSMLLGIQSSRDYILLTNNETLTADYYDTMFSKNIGYPIDNYSVISGTNVYQRAFTKALVLVNPSDNSYTLHLDETFTDLDEANISGSYLMPAHTGEVLYLSGRGSPYASIEFQLPQLWIFGIVALDVIVASSLVIMLIADAGRVRSRSRRVTSAK